MEDYVAWLMGIRPDGKTKTVTADPMLPEGVTYAKMTGYPAFGRLWSVVVENGCVTVSAE